MPGEPELPQLPQDVLEYLLDQKMRELQLNVRHGELKQRLDKLEDHLKLLENRDDDLTCTIAADNVYQVSTVKDVRDYVSTQLADTLDDYQRVCRKLSRLQRHIKRDHNAIYDNWIRNHFIVN